MLKMRWLADRRTSGRMRVPSYVSGDASVEMEKVFTSSEIGTQPSKDTVPRDACVAFKARTVLFDRSPHADPSLNCALLERTAFLN
jgi:hypothetical protein